MRPMSLKQVWNQHKDSEEKRKPLSLEDIFNQQQSNQTIRQSAARGVPVVISSLMHNDLKAYCEKNGLNINEIVEIAINKYINR